MDPRRAKLRMHATLSRIVELLLPTPLGESFKDRVGQVAALKALEPEIDKREALATYMWVIENADGDGLPLTAAGYLKPAYVRSLATVMPTMNEWPFKMASEVDVYPVFSFREQLQAIGILRKYKNSLRASRMARAFLIDPDGLWDHLAAALIPDERSFRADASAILLVHLASTEGEIDITTIARTLTTVGWQFSDGTPVSRNKVYDELNELWDLLGNVSGLDTDKLPDFFHSPIASPAARLLIHDALFDEF